MPPRGSVEEGASECQSAENVNFLYYTLIHLYDGELISNDLSLDYKKGNLDHSSYHVCGHQMRSFHYVVPVPPHINCLFRLEVFSHGVECAKGSARK